MTATYRFHEVAAYGQKRIRCAGGCGRTLRRQQKFYQTLNPWNKNALGDPKSREEIRAELRDEIAAWKQQPETCRECAS